MNGHMNCRPAKKRNETEIHNLDLGIKYHWIPIGSARHSLRKLAGVVGIVVPLSETLKVPVRSTLIMKAMTDSSGQ